MWTQTHGGQKPLIAARQLKEESNFERLQSRRKDYALGTDWGSGFSSASLEDGWQRA